MVQAVEDFSAGHWVVRRLGSTLRVEPSGYRATAWFAVVMVVVALAAMYALPGMTFSLMVLFGIGASIIGIVVFAQFIWLHHYQQRLGPFLEISQSGFTVRGYGTIPRKQFRSFEIRTTQEMLGDGQQAVYRLVLVSTAGQDIPILACVIKSAVTNLKKELDEELETSAGERLPDDGSPM